MLAVTNIDVFVLMNGLLRRYPKAKVPKVYYGLSSYFATSPQHEHAIVLDAELMFRGVTPTPSNIVEDGVINWEMLDAYLERPAKKLPKYVMQRVNVIDDMLQKAAANDKHALSAMLSNFTPAARPEVTKHVIAFLIDPSKKAFSLPQNLIPKRGRAVGYYEAATQADYSALKRDIQKDVPDEYEARYWKKVIAKRTNGSKPQK